MKYFNNPLFESLVFKANGYGILDEQGNSGKAPPRTVYQDFAVSLAIIGSKLVENYIKAVAGYPETAFKKKYIKELPSKIGDLTKVVNPQDNINAQITALLTAVTKEVNDFLGQSKSDGVYGKHLVKWRNALRDAFSYYKMGIEEAKTYMAKYTGTFDPKITATLYKSLTAIKTGVEKAANANHESLNVSRYNKTGESATGSMGIIEKLIHKKIAIDFSTFSTLVNEENLTKRQAKKEAKGLLADIDSTIGSINGVLTQLAARESDPRRENFKSIQMKSSFAQIGGDINDIRTQITDDAGNLKPRRDLAELPLDQLGSDFDKAQTLFTDKQKEYEDLYSNEEGGLKSTKTLDIATPEVNKKISDGDQFFGTLSSLSLYAGQMAAEEIAKTTAAATGNAGTSGAASLGDFKIKDPIKKGSNDKENIKKFQQLVLDKMKSLKSKAGWYDSLEASAKQFGNFGSKTDSAIRGIKGGLNIKDGNSDITQELIDKISSWDGKIKESYSLLEQFDLKASNAASGSGGSLKSPSKRSSGGESGSKSSGTEIKSTAFDCIKKTESKLIIKGKQATITRDNGSIHTFNSDGTYKFYYITKKKTQEGNWKCTDDSYEAYTEEDKDTYYGSKKDWKSNLDNAEKAKAEGDKKAAEALSDEAGEICKEILVNLAGDTEEEEAIMDIFQKKITTAAMFNAVETFWNNKFWPSTGQLRNSKLYYKNKSVKEITKGMDYKIGKYGSSLRDVIRKYFNNGQIARLNSYLPSGIKTI